MLDRIKAAKFFSARVPTRCRLYGTLELTCFEEEAGGSGTEKFDRTRHISSLFCVQRDGIRWTEKR
jgi:hypothetical protein